MTFFGSESRSISIEPRSPTITDGCPDAQTFEYTTESTNSGYESRAFPDASKPQSRNAERDTISPCGSPKIISAQLIAYTPRSSSAAFPSVRSKVFTRSPARKRSYLDEYCVNSNRAERIDPISPSADLICAIAGSCAGRIASANTAPLRSAAAIAASSDISSAAAGFSQSTFIP